MKFANWLQFNEANSIRELYHGTTSGNNNATLNSFLQNGVQPKSGSGYGQGDGFYVFSDFKTASSHALTLVSSNAMMAVNAAHAGEPMVVVIVGNLHPSEWDLDFELNKRKILAFLLDNYDKLKNSNFNRTNGEFSIRRKFDYPATWTPISGDIPARHGLQFKGATNRSMTDGPEGNDGDVGTGETLSAVFEKLKQGHSELTDAFETSFYANMGTGVAVKYVGNHPLKVSRIYKFSEQQWMQVR